MMEDASGDRPPPDRIVGDFELLRLLGQGGMGEVWEARQRSVGRLVALKLLPLGLAENPRAVLRFRREAEAGGRLQHPHIAVVYSAGLADGRLYIAQELIPGGRSLADWLRKVPRTERLPEAHFQRVAELVTQVAHALHYAHEKGVIHRDVKPQNILLAPSGEAKLVDFGLAQVDDGFTLSQSGDLAGTYAYMSPEQARARAGEIDHRTDVFSLGATLYELLTLVPPFRGSSVPEITEKILHETPEDPCVVRQDVPSALAAACLRALEKDRANRFQSALALAQAILPEPGPRTPTQVGSARESPPSRHIWQWKVPLLVAALLAFVGWRTLSVKRPVFSDPLLESFRYKPTAFEGLSYFPQLAAFAREQVARYEAANSSLLPGDPIIERLRQTIVPRVLIEKATKVKDAIRSIPQLRDFPLFFDPSADQVQTPIKLDLAHPSRADVLLELLLGREGRWMAESDRLVIAGASVPGNLVLESYPLNDLIGVEDPMSGLRFVPEPWEPWKGDPRDYKFMIQENIAVGTWEDAGVAITTEEARIFVKHDARVQRQVGALLAGIRTLQFRLGDDKRFWDSLNRDRGSLEADQAIADSLATLIVDTLVAQKTLDAVLATLETSLQRDILLYPPEGTEESAIQWLLGTSVESAPLVLSGPLSRLIRPKIAVLGGIVHIGVHMGMDRWGAGLATRGYLVWDLTAEHMTSEDERRLITLPQGGEVELSSSPRVVSADGLDTLIRDLVHPELWETYPGTNLRIHDGLMLVTAPPFMHREIEALVHGLRAASHDAKGD